MNVKHTAENLGEKIKEVLEEYNISLNNVYSITSDNAANFIKCSKLINTSVSLAVTSHVPTLYANSLSVSASHPALSTSSLSIPASTSSSASVWSISDSVSVTFFALCHLFQH